MKILLEERFSDLDLARMFNVIIGKGKNGQELRLWRIRKHEASRGFKEAMQDKDYLVQGVSEHPAGSEGRVADLAAHYAAQETGQVDGNGSIIYRDYAVSPFDIPEIDD